MTLRDVLTGPVTKIVPAEMLRPSFYGMLGIYYLSIGLYGATATIFGVQSIKATTGDHFTFLWSLLLGICGIVAMHGVWLSRRFKREWIEVCATCILVGQLIGYAVAIGTHAFLTDNVSNLAASWLPLIIALLPIWRLAMIALEGNLFKKSRIARTR